MVSAVYLIVGRFALFVALSLFFGTSRGRRVSHVGIYIGADEFIHAPGKDKQIRTDSLSNTYFAKRYVGTRTYLK